MSIQEIIYRRWWMLLISALILFFGFGYGCFRMESHPYVEYFMEKEAESQLDEIIAGQKGLTTVEQMENYLDWSSDQGREMEELATQERWEEHQQLNDLLNMYHEALLNKVEANNLLLLGKGEETILFDGNVPADFLEHRELYGRMEEAFMMNSHYVLRFLGLEQYNFSLLTGIFLAVCFWGGHYESSVNRQFSSTPQGRRFTLACHGVLMLLTVLFAVLGWLLSMAGSGLLSVPQYWDVMIRGYKSTMHNFNSILISMTVMEFCLSLLSVHICNGVIFYLLSYWFVKNFRNIRSAFLGSFGVLLACYFMGSMFRGKGSSSWFQLGYQSDVTYWVRDAVWVDGVSMTSLEAGAVLIGLVLIIMLGIWLFIETRNPYRVERRKG